MQVVLAPDQRLRIKTRPVKKITPAYLQTLKKMIALTKTFKDPEGVGLASTQVGLRESFFVAKNAKHKKQEKAPFIMILNPKITWSSKRMKRYFEGCLSIPNIWGQLNRHYSIKVIYQDQSGKLIKTTLKGVLAWIFQHEIDHLNGILFTQRVLEQKGKFYKVVGKDKAGADIYEEVKI